VESNFKFAVAHNQRTGVYFSTIDPRWLLAGLVYTQALSPGRDGVAGQCRMVLNLALRYFGGLNILQVESGSRAGRRHGQYFFGYGRVKVRASPLCASIPLCGFEGPPRPQAAPNATSLSDTFDRVFLNPR